MSKYRAKSKIVVYHSGVITFCLNQIHDIQIQPQTHNAMRDSRIFFPTLKEKVSLEGTGGAEETGIFFFLFAKFSSRLIFR